MSSRLEQHDNLAKSMENDEIIIPYASLIKHGNSSNATIMLQEEINKQIEVAMAQFNVQLNNCVKNNLITIEEAMNRGFAAEHEKFIDYFVNKINMEMQAATETLKSQEEMSIASISSSFERVDESSKPEVTQDIAEHHNSFQIDCGSAKAECKTDLAKELSDICKKLNEFSVRVQRIELLVNIENDKKLQSPVEILKNVEIKTKRKKRDKKLSTETSIESNETSQPLDKIHDQQQSPVEISVKFEIEEKQRKRVVHNEWLTETYIGSSDASKPLDKFDKQPQSKTKQKKYSCSHVGCQCSMNDQSNMLRHLKICLYNPSVQGKKLAAKEASQYEVAGSQYKCKLCQKLFATKGSVQRHLDKVH